MLERMTVKFNFINRRWDLLRKKLTILLLLTYLLCGDAITTYAQQPTPTPTGRSYSNGEPARRPPSPAPQEKSPATFKDITASSGIMFQHHASPTSHKYLPESMGAGVAIFDFDNDGRMDLFFTNGALLQDPMPKNAQPDKRDPSFWNRLYHQKADGTFEDVTEKAGVSGANYPFYTMGVAVADYDNDGFPDLFVTGYGGSILYHNNGDGTFTDVTKKLGVFASGWSTSAGWFDYDKDGRLDLFVARYMDWDFERGDLFCGDARFRAYCHPDNFKGASNILFHQKADGTFEDVSAKAGIADAGGKGLGVAFADFDNDGWMDVVVANDSVRQELYRNKGDGTFEDVGVLAGVGYDENGRTFAGMGVAAADYDNDGMTDIFITALSNQTYPLYRNNGDMSFIYSTNTTGVGQITILYAGWGAGFIDFDNDGWRDIFVAQGHVLDTVGKTTSYLTYKQTPLLMRNLNGKSFVNVSQSAGETFNVPLAARGAAFGDLNNDGQTDIVIAVTNGAPFILQNNGTKNHWLGIKLVGTKSNHDGTGARIIVTDGAGHKQFFDANNAGSYLSSNDPRIRVGLGATASVQSIEVRWTSGIVQKIESPAIDRYLTITEK